MCAPLAIAAIGLGLSAAEATASYVGQRNAAGRTEAENKKYKEENTRQAINAQRINEADILHRQSQEILATGTQKHAVNQQVEMDLSTERVAAAEAGVAGNSVDAVLHDIKNAGSAAKTRLDVNSQITQDQLQREKTATAVDAQNRINSVRDVVVNKPSILTPLLDVGGSALQVYDYKLNRDARAKQVGAQGIH